MSDCALVVLPGLDGTTRLLNEFLSLARSRFDSAQAIAYPSHRRLDYEQLELLVREALPRNRPFVLLGESFSGPIAIAIAARPPPGLSALVLSTSFAHAPLRWLRPFAGLIDTVAIAVPPMWVLSWLLFGAWGSNPLRAHLREALDAVDRTVLKQRAGIALRADVATLLPAIRLPMLYLRGSGDRLIPASTGRRLTAQAGQATLVDIPGPHLLLQAQPAACLQAIIEFCDRQGLTRHRPHSALQRQ